MALPVRPGSRKGSPRGCPPPDMTPPRVHRPSSWLPRPDITPHPPRCATREKPHHRAAVDPPAALRYAPCAAIRIIHAPDTTDTPVRAALVAALYLSAPPRTRVLALCSAMSPNTNAENPMQSPHPSPYGPPPGTTPLPTTSSAQYPEAYSTVKLLNALGLVIWLFAALTIFGAVIAMSSQAPNRIPVAMGIAFSGVMQIIMGVLVRAVGQMMRAMLDGSVSVQRVEGHVRRVWPG